MIFGGPLFALATLALLAYCIFDVIRTDESQIQNLPKMFWVLLIIFIPLIGSVAWLLLGRPSGADFQLRGPQSYRPHPSEQPTGYPESRPTPEEHEARRQETLRRYMAEREEQLRRREEEVRRLEEELRRKSNPEDEETP